jgi:hypothetical protein
MTRQRVRGAYRGRCVWLAFSLACVSLSAGEVEMPGRESAEAPTLGAHTLLAQPDWHGNSPATTQAIATAASGSSLLVLVGGFASNAAPPIDSYRRHWTQVGQTAVYDGYQGRFDVKAYLSLTGGGGAGHTVSIDKPGKPDREISVPFVEIRHAGVLQDFAQNYPAPNLAERIVGKLGRAVDRLASGEAASTFRMTSGEVTTTGPATLIAVWWGDGNVRQMSAVPDSDFKVIDSFLQLPPESGVQCAVAYRQVDRAGTYQVTWSGSPRQRAILWLFAFQSTSRPGAGQEPAPAIQAR